MTILNTELPFVVKVHAQTKFSLPSMFCCRSDYIVFEKENDAQGISDIGTVWWCLMNGICQSYLKISNRTIFFFLAHTHTKGRENEFVCVIHQHVYTFAQVSY